MKIPHLFVPLCLLAAPFAEAATVAHWLFDTAAPLVDSAGSHPLTNNNTTTTFSGGSAIFNGGGAGGQLMSTPDSAAWSDTSFTVESFFTPTTLNTSGPNTIVSHLQEGTGRQWLFGVDSGGNLTMLIGQSTEVYFVNAAALPKIVNGHSYYVAAAIDLTAADAASRITFYLQDLTLGTAMVTANSSSAPEGNLVSSTAPLTIGSTGHSSSRLNGSISEIRISDVKLTADALLIPEPTVVLLSSLGLIPLLRRRR